MTRELNRNFWIAAWLVLCIAIVWYFFGAPLARADEVPCPANAKSCKVLTLTPDEQDMLLRDKGVLQTAVQARPLDLGAIIQYWVNKIEAAPAGKVVEAPKTEDVNALPLKPAPKPAEKK